MVRRMILFGLLSMLMLGAGRAGFADPAAPITLKFPARDNLSVSDVLRAVSMQTGAIILPDSSVVGATGDIDVTESAVPDVLTYLKTFEPGLTWQIVYYPNGQNEPSGEDLYKTIQLLQNSPLQGLVIPPSGDDKVMYSFKKQMYATPDQEKAAEAGFQPYYLVSDPTERAALAKAAAPPATAPVNSDKAAQFSATLTSLESQITKLTPQQQVFALNEMAAASKQINASLSPQAIATLKAMAQGQPVR